MDMAELKRQAVQYYNEHQIPAQIESLLNLLFFDKPPDLYGYMSNYFRKLSNAPVITEVKVMEAINPSGYETVRFVVYCRVNGMIKECFSLEPLLDKRMHREKPSLKSQTAKLTGKKDSKSKMNKKDVPSQDVSSETSQSPTSFKDFQSFNSFVSLTHNDILPLIYNCSLDNQVSLDEKICSKDVSKIAVPQTGNSLVDISPLPENSIVQIVKQPASIASGSVTDRTSRHASITSQTSVANQSQLSAAIFFTSLMTSYAKSVTQSTSWYSLLCQEFYAVREEESLMLPTPAVSFICTDLSSPGKLNMFKNVYLLPKLHSLTNQSVLQLIAFYHHIDEELSAKQTVVKNSRGAFHLSFERPEQVFELLASSCKTYFNGELGDLFDIILDVSANDIYDEEKKKYEISMGTSKTGHDLLSMYSHWLDNYPIIGLIDAVAEQDGTSMEALCDQLYDHCFIINRINVRNGERVVTEGVIGEKVHGNGIYFRPEDSVNAISQIGEVLETLQGGDGVDKRVLFMDDEWSSFQTHPLGVDMSVACRSLFVGCASSTSYGCNSLSRWLQIYNELKDKDLFMSRDSYGFKERKVSGGSTEVDDDGMTER